MGGELTGFAKGLSGIPPELWQTRVLRTVLHGTAAPRRHLAPLAVAAVVWLWVLNPIHGVLNKVLAVVDPNGPSTNPERVTELITPIARNEIETPGLGAADEATLSQLQPLTNEAAGVLLGFGQISLLSPVRGAAFQSILPDHETLTSSA